LTRRRHCLLRFGDRRFLLFRIGGERANFGGDLLLPLGELLGRGD
jgi:hypothetical protein